MSHVATSPTLIVAKKMDEAPQQALIAHPHVDVLGVAMSAIDMNEAVQMSDRLLSSGGRGYVCVTGVHGVMEAQTNDEFREILNGSFMTVPDGMPTVWVGRIEGHNQMGRVYGPDFMLRMCELSVARGYSQFLYGGNEGVAEQLAAALTARFPGLKIAGTYTPPFRKLTEAENKELANLVKEVRPDIFWVGLSTPKQEKFMAEYMARLEVKVMAGVGAAFDIHTGRIKDAPGWIKVCGLQWLHRLFQEPRRLARRYLTNNPRFLFRIGLHYLKPGVTGQRNPKR